jgi:hypothetical protein
MSEDSQNRIGKRSNAHTHQLTDNIRDTYVGIIECLSITWIRANANQEVSNRTSQFIGLTKTDLCLPSKKRSKSRIPMHDPGNPARPIARRILGSRCLRHLGS